MLAPRSLVIFGFQSLVVFVVGSPCWHRCLLFWPSPNHFAELNQMPPTDLCARVLARQRSAASADVDAPRKKRMTRPSSLGPPKLRLLTHCGSSHGPSDHAHIGAQASY